jgi:carboxyl-terminal processing protease
MPGFFDSATFGETSYDNALPWVQIKPARYTQDKTLASLLPALKSRHDERVKNDPDFQRMLDDIADLKAQREKATVSLNEAERRKERAAQEKRLNDRASPAGGDDAPSDDGLQSNERSLKADLATENARKNAKDVLLNEAAAILADEADLQAKDK